jgi:hypothetical protein
MPLSSSVKVLCEKVLADKHTNHVNHIWRKPMLYSVGLINTIIIIHLPIGGRISASGCMVSAIWFIQRMYRVSARARYSFSSVGSAILNLLKVCNKEA